MNAKTHFDDDALNTHNFVPFTAVPNSETTMDMGICTQLSTKSTEVMSNANIYILFLYSFPYTSTLNVNMFEKHDSTVMATLINNRILSRVTSTGIWNIKNVWSVLYTEVVYKLPWEVINSSSIRVVLTVS